MKSRTPLQQAAFCALADFQGFYNENLLLEDMPSKRTVKELYEALRSDGCDVSDYVGFYLSVCEDLDYRGNQDKS